jgi:hypothetical protein
LPVKRCSAGHNVEARQAAAIPRGVAIAVVDHVTAYEDVVEVTHGAFGCRSDPAG